MRLIYILVCAFFILLCLIAYYNYKRKKIGLQDFLIWTVAFITLAFLSLFPDTLDIVREALGFKLRENFILTMVCIITASFIFFQLNANRRMKKENVKLAQMAGIHDLFLNHMAGNHIREKKQHDTLVKMAAYNEAENLEQVLKAMPQNVDILVVDDGSDDNTAEVAGKYGAMVIRHPINMGQGIGDLTGFMLAFNLHYEIVVEMDADGQHPPAEIPHFIDLLHREKDLDIVVGSRITGSSKGDVCKMRKTFLPAYTRLINWASGYSLTDALCGFKAYRTQSLLKHPGLFEGLIETEYIAAEMYIRFGSAGLRVREIPVNLMARQSGRSRKGTFRYGFAVAWVIFRTLLDNRSKKGHG